MGRVGDGPILSVNKLIQHAIPKVLYHLRTMSSEGDSKRAFSEGPSIGLYYTSLSRPAPLVLNVVIRKDPLTINSALCIMAGAEVAVL